MNKLFLTLGIMCFVVPFLLQIIDGREQENIIATYEKTIESYGEEEMGVCLENAKTYNEILYQLQSFTSGLDLTEGDFELDYENELNLAKTGIMGHLQIPKIDLKLPVYHGTSDEVLAAGIGHLEGTSLPTGGENCHVALTGHCGLPSAELFTRLDELEEGDLFFLQVCQEVMAYEVVEIQVVEPEVVDALEMEAGRDLVSLITCTPYGINTHRLIVTGERAENEADVENLISEEAERGVDEKIYFIILGGTVLLMYPICRSIRRKRRDYSARGNGI